MAEWRRRVMRRGAWSVSCGEREEDGDGEGAGDGGAAAAPSAVLGAASSGRARKNSRQGRMGRPTERGTNHGGGGLGEGEEEEKEGEADARVKGEEKDMEAVEVGTW